MTTIRIPNINTLSSDSGWITIYDRFWKFIAVMFLFLVTIQVGVNGYKVGLDRQRVEIEKIKLALDLVSRPSPTSKPQELERL